MSNRGREGDIVDRAVEAACHAFYGERWEYVNKESARQWMHDALLTAQPVAAKPAQEKCFCDRMYPDSNPDASCGDCPTRDYQTVTSGLVTEGMIDSAMYACGGDMNAYWPPETREEWRIAIEAALAAQTQTAEPVVQDEPKAPAPSNKARPRSIGTQFELIAHCPLQLTAALPESQP